MKTKRILTFASALIIITLVAERAIAQTDSIVTYNATLVNKRTSKPISGVTVTYKKLPYESEVGVLTSDASGKVTAYLRAHEQYSFLIEPQGFIKVAEIVKPVEGADADLVNNVTYQLREGGVGSVLRLENLNFERGSAKITEGSHSSLDDLVAMMNESTSIRIQLEGHTDFRGSPTANLKLSEQRVIAVKKYLVGKGIASDRIETKAFGGSQPITRGNSELDRAKNRRVEVRILSDNRGN